MTELAFFVGKGGVGKTTVATAYAVHTARRYPRSRVLLVSTDPAHSLADVLQLKLGDSPKATRVGRGKLWVWQLNAPALFGNFFRRYKQSILEIVERGSLFSAAEIAPLIETALPGMSEISALLAIRDAIDTKKYTHVVVDTAPFGHTLRLFSLPEQFIRVLNFLELAAGRDRVLAAHFGGGAQAAEPKLIEDWRGKIDQIAQAFSAAELFLVTTAETFALNESVRCMKEVRESNRSLQLRSIVLNRVVRRAGNCSVCRKKVKAARMAESFLRKQFASDELRIGEDPGFPIMGAEALLSFGKHVFANRRLQLPPQRPKATQKLGSLSPTEWPALNSRISFVIGKGGVGKTTISAALGFHQRKTCDTAVEICSVDPAPSLDDIFQTTIGDNPKAVLDDEQFRASELDSAALFRSWIAEIREDVNSATISEQSGIHVDLSFERELLSALLDIVPPGLDEVLAIFRIMDLRSSTTGKIIIDMAPTGHALELLRMPERIVTWSRLLLKSLAAHRKLALARNAAVRIAELELRARELLQAFKHAGEVNVFVVMLPEPLPDRETERLMVELGQLGLTANALFVNRVLFAKNTSNCSRCRSAAEWQSSVLTNLKTRQSAKKIFAIRNFMTEIVGATGLRAITDELWRLN
ncbi:MAG TPA: ArsA family ATPase [Terriglobales bacterium]|nr:ArsA family ATPase [Terriglobales bacterium]